MYLCVWMEIYVMSEGVKYVNRICLSSLVGAVMLALGRSSQCSSWCSLKWYYYGTNHWRRKRGGEE